MRRPLLMLIALTLLATPLAPATVWARDGERHEDRDRSGEGHADDDRHGGGRRDDRRDRDDIRHAVEDGEIMPLHEILERVRAVRPGEIASVEIERKKGEWRYEVRVIEPGGRLVEVYVDARTGAIVKSED